MAARTEEHVVSPAETSDRVLEELEEEIPHGGNTSDNDHKIAEKAAPQQQKPADGGEKKPSKLKEIWAKLGLDAMTLKMMFKGSVAPTVAIAMYQAPSVTTEYSTLGYLVAITANLGMAILPRGVFIQTMVLDVFAICLGAATNLLGLFCAVKAREHTMPPTPPSTSGALAAPTYNSSQSAILAVWLIIEVYLISVMRDLRPQYMFPCILISIFTAVSMFVGLTLPDMSAAMTFVQFLLKIQLTGLALATGVHIFVFPTSSRKVVFLQMTGYLKLMNGVLKLNTAYMASLQNFDPMAAKANGTGKDTNVSKANEKKKRKRHDEHADHILQTPPGIKLTETLNKLLELHAKLSGGITPAKREIAIGKLESHDITVLWKLLKQIFLPVVGLSSMITILERLAKQFHWDKKEDEVTEEEDETRHRQLDYVHFIMKHLQEPFALMIENLDGAFQHILLTLEFVKPEKKQKQPDEESKGDEPAKPGSSAYAEAFKRKVDDFYESKKKTLQEWCKQHGIDLPPDFFETSFVYPQNIYPLDERVRERRQRQLFFVLYLEYLLWRCSRSVLDLILYVDKRKQEGAFKSAKVIFPGSKTIYKWIKSVFGQEDFNHVDSYMGDADAGGQQSVYVSEKFWRLRDPEHSPPQNTWEKVGDQLRRIPRGLRSDSSAFGLRVAAAVMTLGIVAFLKDTQLWFLQQRGQWAIIMILISMTRTSGQSVFNFVLRVFGTAVAMVLSYVVWYIVDGKTAGIIVFIWLLTFCCYYVPLKFLKYAVVGVLTLVTVILIAVYELQVRILGKKIATSNGQPDYPLYILAPYRLATVVIGLFVAFIWTVLPYPISETSELRNDLSSCMFLLSAFYENVHETIAARVSGKAGNASTKGTYAYNLERARQSLFGKLVVVLNNLRTNSDFSRFQLRIGGRFPREEYQALIDTLRRLVLWTSLASYSSASFLEGTDEEMTQWSITFRKVLANTNETSHSITSLLSVLSSSLSNGTPLPPYIKMPEPFAFVRRVNQIDKDMLSIRHISEPEYNAFAVLQIVARMINDDVAQLREHTKNLVGEIDFSFRAADSSSLSTASSSTDEIDGNKSKDD